MIAWNQLRCMRYYDFENWHLMFQLALLCRMLVVYFWCVCLQYQRVMKINSLRPSDTICGHWGDGLIRFNPLRPRPNRRHFADDIFKCIFENENEWISLRISLKFVPKVPINNIPALVQIMAWRRPGDGSLSEPMMVSLLTHICVTRPQWVNSLWPSDAIWQQIWVNIGSGNGLLPDGTKPLPEPMLTNRHPPEMLWHSCDGNFTVNVPDIYAWYKFEND